MNAVEIEEAISALAQWSFVGVEFRLRWKSAYNICVAGKTTK
jgi:hypothetical protein